MPNAYLAIERWFHWAITLLQLHIIHFDWANCGNRKFLGVIEMDCCLRIVMRCYFICSLSLLSLHTCFSADSLMIFSPDISKHIVLPSDINIILSDAEPCSLVEVTLRTLHRHQRFFDNLADDSLPKTFYKILQRGPVAVCSYDPCKSPIFLQCHFSLIRK